MDVKSKILTTGVLSGIGRHIHESIGSIGLTRSTTAEERELIKKEGIDVIIHCAFNSRRVITSDYLYHYFSDNVLLTNELVNIPHKKFIFFSTLAVYPVNETVHKEDEVFDMDTLHGIYPITKFQSESIVMNRCKDYLILRSSGLMGRYSRRNSLIRIIEDDNCKLTLSADSRINYILHSDVLAFIKFAIENDLKGIYNMCSTDAISLGEMAEMVGKKVNWGSYCYDIGRHDNSKIASIFPVFKKTSREVVSQFIEERYKRKIHQRK